MADKNKEMGQRVQKLVSDVMFCSFFIPGLVSLPWVGADRPSTPGEGVRWGTQMAFLLFTKVAGAKRIGPWGGS